MVLMPGNDLPRKFTRDRTHDVRSPGLTIGFHTGVVVGNLQPNNLVIVRPDGQYRTVTCIWAAGIVSGLLGFKTSFLPPADTRVGFYYTGQAYSFIVGSYSDVVPLMNLDRAITDPTGTPVASQEVYTQQKDDAARVADAHGQPVDLLEGEIDISNLMGVGISLLRNMASIQASDLARVECLLLDDVVRIISQNFKQHSAFGDFSITNDGGRLSVEWQGTSHDFEAWGMQRPGDAKAKLKDSDHVEMKDTVDGYNDDGRWRFSQYMGWLGDFINVFVTDPVAAMGRLAVDQLRSGKARVHINNDGAVLVQSVADIVLEKVVRIPVPVRVRRTEDPLGNRSDTGPKNQLPLAQWKPSGEALFEMAFQLREYARWLNSLHGLERFRQMDRDFRVPSEADTPEPQLNSAEQDKKDFNGNTDNWALGYSCIRIYRDGSVQTVDAYGNSMLTSAVGVQISSTQDILLQAAGSVNIVAGRDINLLAQKNIGITAVLKKVRIKAKEGIMALIENGKFIVDFVQENLFYIRKGKLNVNDKLATTFAGNLDVMGNITGIEVLAALTMMHDDHPGHLFTGAPEISDMSSNKFEFQEDQTYGDVPLYQTHAQSVLGRSEKASNATWSLKNNAVPDRTGAPWPGTDPKEKKLPSDINDPTVGGINLNTPMSQDPVSTPKAPMVDADAEIKAQT